jgi:Kef-type K+ transport system membrane component KefB
VLLRLQDTTDQIRIRGAFVLLAVFAALAERLGLEVILGAFLAGALLTLVDSNKMLTHPRFRTKLEAIGFGVFVPFFFVTSGLRFDLAALVASPATLARVPLFLAALLRVRGAPALLYRSLVGGRRTVVAGLLEATTLTFIVAATQIGQALGLMGAATAAALVAAGLLSVLLFPLGALTLLQRAGQPAAGPPSVALAHDPPVQTDG